MAESSLKITVTAARAVTMERLTEDLEKARLLAHEEGQAEAAVSACVAMAKLHGLVIDRSEVETITTTIKDITDEDIQERHRQIAIEEIRSGGRDYLVNKLAECENLLAIYDAGEFEEWAAQGGSSTKH